MEPPRTEYMKTASFAGFILPILKFNPYDMVRDEILLHTPIRMLFEVLQTTYGKFIKNGLIRRSNIWDESNIC